MRGVRAPLYTQELLQSWVLSRGTTVSWSVSELWAGEADAAMEGHRARPRRQSSKKVSRPRTEPRRPKDESPGWESRTLGKEVGV